MASSRDDISRRKRREELRLARAEAARKARQRLVIGAVAVVAVLIIVILIVVKCSKGSDSSSTSKKSDTTKVEKFSGSVEPTVTDTKGKVALSWEAFESATSYSVLRADTAEGTFEAIGNTETNEYTDTTVTKRTKYYYQVIPEKKSKDGKIAQGDASEALEAYVLPAKPKMAIVGECYVEGISEWAKGELPKNTLILGKEGTTTYKIINDSDYSYKGSNVSALERTAVYKPDIVCLLVGMNEATNQDTLDTISNFDEIISSLQQINENVKVVIMAVSPTGKTSSLNIPTPVQRDNFNHEYEAFAETKDNVYYYDYSEIITGEDGYLSAESDAGDGCHWTSAATINVMKDLMIWLDDYLY